MDKLGVEIPEVEEKKSFVVTLKGLKEGKRHDVFFYQPKFMEIEKAIKLIMGNGIIIKYNLVDVIDSSPSGKYRYVFSRIED